MNQDQTLKWEKLYRLLEHHKKESTELCIHEGDQTYITVDYLKHQESGCGLCGKRYDNFALSGMFHSSYEPRILPYSAEVSQYDMHICIDEEECDGFYPLFKGTIENTQHCVCHVYIDFLVD